MLMTYMECFLVIDALIYEGKFLTYKQENIYTLYFGSELMLSINHGMSDSFLASISCSRVLLETYINCPSPHFISTPKQPYEIVVVELGYCKSAMARKKVNLQWISNNATRRAMYKRRSQGLEKKASELATLCGTSCVQSLPETVNMLSVYLFAECN